MPLTGARTFLAPPRLGHYSHVDDGILDDRYYHRHRNLSGGLHSRFPPPGLGSGLGSRLGPGIGHELGGGYDYDGYGYGYDRPGLGAGRAGLGLGAGLGGRGLSRVGGIGGAGSSLAAYDLAEAGLEREYEEDMMALEDLRHYEEHLRLDRALSEEERLARWRRRLEWEELSSLEERRLHWERMAETDREVLGLGTEGLWGSRFLDHHHHLPHHHQLHGGGYYGGYAGGGYRGGGLIDTHHHHAGLDNWGHEYIGPHGRPLSYADRHPELPYSNPIPRTQFSSQRLLHGHYPLSATLRTRYEPLFSRLSRRG